jgi:hypothetical protein
MATSQLSNRSTMAASEAAWPLELDGELSLGCDATAERLGHLVRLLARTPWVDQASVSTRCGGCGIRAGLTVRAPDLPAAAERAISLLHQGALDAGLGGVVLVAVRTPTAGPERGLRAG